MDHWTTNSIPGAVPQAAESFWLSDRGWQVSVSPRSCNQVYWTFSRSSYIFLAHNAGLVTLAGLVPLACTVADWSGQSTAPHWPVHLDDWLITDSVAPVVVFFWKAAIVQVSSLQQSLFILFGYFFSSTTAFIIISPKSALSPDIDQWLASAALIQLVVSDRHVSHYFFSWSLSTVNCVL